MLYSSIPARRREIASVVHFSDRCQKTGQLQAGVAASGSIGTRFHANEAEYVVL